MWGSGAEKEGCPCGVKDRKNALRQSKHSTRHPGNQTGMASSPAGRVSRNHLLCVFCFVCLFTVWFWMGCEETAARTLKDRACHGWRKEMAAWPQEKLAGSSLQLSELGALGGDRDPGQLWGWVLKPSLYCSPGEFSASGCIAFTWCPINRNTVWVTLLNKTL